MIPRRASTPLRTAQLPWPEDPYRVLVDAARDYAIFFLDPRGQVVSWNTGAARLKGYSAHEIIGRHFSAFYPPDAIERQWPQQELKAAREKGRVEDEGWRVRKDGTRFWANVVITALYDARAELRGYAKVTRHLTDARRIEAVEKAERQAPEFLAMLAHELRNPLAPIRNALHLLSRKPTSDPAEQWVREVLQRQTGQMTRLVDDLLDVSRVTRDSIVLENKTLDARNIARAALDASRQWFDERHQELTVSLGEEALFVEGDEVRLVQVLQNLLHNAAKFTADGGRIELAMRREGGEVLISVKDQGSGMTREMLESAFQLFHQGSQGLERRHGGLGVGLTLVQRLVMLHDGSVQAKSAGPGRGSEFIVRLPCGNAAGNPSASAATQGKKDSAS